ncbi:flagellar hook-length control protein FliK [Bartonella bacilliformis]|uniref:Flagellar hook-length control protein-like C-terminal domain-containing protein n=1 Tax=Bartonella bacilliformis Ver097 TaxID=1293911 RepID=A0A072QXZ4_BARBA|nr:flagellar hook-length control protein FliK [Bartonella bacilliformis]KEG18310.1 hypothetical protein H710_01159 [Bartonella bacilliformis Ver097]
MINIDGLSGFLSALMSPVNKISAQLERAQGDIDNQFDQEFGALVNRDKKHFSHNSSPMQITEGMLESNAATSSSASTFNRVLDKKDEKHHTNKAFEKVINQDEAEQEEVNKDFLWLQTEEEVSDKALKAKHSRSNMQKSVALQGEEHPLCLSQQFVKQEIIEKKIGEFTENERGHSAIRGNRGEQWIANMQKAESVEEDTQTSIKEKNLKVHKHAQHFTQNFTHSLIRGSESSTVRFDVETAKSLFLGDFKMGDNVAMQQEKPNFISQFSDVHVTLNKKVGHVQLLHLKLTPVELGSIDAKLRMTTQGLHVELQAQHQETARLLAHNQEMLILILEKAHIHDGGRLSVTIIDKNAQSGQLSQMDQGVRQNNSEQNSHGQHQAFDHNDQSGQNESRQFFKRFLLEDSSLVDLSLEDVHPRNSRRLVV